ncbi:MAG TPA: DEAD/DEAH box helicase [Bacilli bacterium]|nr:DEAD/DEAH box helicase [Bacilli bacterium]
MKNVLSIRKTHDLMKDRFVDYITSQYFGENQLLLNSADELLRNNTNLFQKPFIESTPSYKKVKDGIKNSNIDEKVKKFFLALIDKKLGVFETPFKHQVDSLEQFVEGRNLFVATGTGSGKTECFMWPIIYKLVNEAINAPKTWETRGVRTIVIYPMNALVSDQIARLRSIIGDQKNEFVKFLNAFAPNERRPQFGMYTGRTPYSGNGISKKNNKEIADSYEKSYLIEDALTEEEKVEKEKDIEGLKRINKYPSINMKTFVNALRSDTPGDYDSSNDAELMLRYEMQRHCPDILITNYSMLEYMLVRKVESNIWYSTINWLNQSKDNKILIVIDEAHMYSGASGGEVAFLIRRLLSKLGINNDRIQFIMTSASMPHGSEEDMVYIRNFVEAISTCRDDTFEYNFGETEDVVLNNPIKFDVKALADLALKNDVLSDETIAQNIRIFAKEIFGEEIKNNEQLWLYKNISRYEPFVKLLNLCKGNAVSYNEMQDETIGQLDEQGNKAFENLLLLAPLAKDDGGNVLFPARIHLFFRGLNGIYACLNPECHHPHAGDDVKIGALFTREKEQCPYCHSKVFELINDRRCGALFIKTFIHKDAINAIEVNCWPRKGIDEKEELMECPLFILPPNYDLESRPKNTELAYFDFMSGKLYSRNINKKTCIRVLKSSVFDTDEVHFEACPKCGKRFKFIGLSDFKVKGNLPFYSIIKAQFDAQPMTKEPSKFLPNGGKKVLLFSDSRQSAAILARDLTKLSDADAFKKAIYLAMGKVYSSVESNELPMNYLYPAFVETSIENKLRFFYGKELDKFEEDKKRLARLLERNKRLNRKNDYSRMQSELNTPCAMYQADLIELFCSPTISFHNLGLGYIAPLKEKLEDALLDIDEPRLTEDEFIKIFLSFICQAFTDSFAFDNTVPENIRKEVKYIKGNRYGFNKYDSYINEKIKEKYPLSYSKIYDAIVQNFFRKEDEYYFLNLQTAKIVLTDADYAKWVRCKRCESIHPFSIENRCSICGSSNIEERNVKDLKQIDYWRKPIVSEEIIKSLNTEEHTAQLSYKDQKIETWAKTEDYEMRFQDINVEKENANPIDILSCTTTMEVGIDIGSLTAIGLRNVPPLRENYQQRAGRAGRRGTSLSTISVYAQGGPHDTYYFNNPEKIIKGKPRKPWIDIKSEKIICRHFNLVVFTRFFDTRVDSLYDCTTKDFVSQISIFEEFVNRIIFTEEEIDVLFVKHETDAFKTKLLKDIDNFVNAFDGDDKKKLFDDLFTTGILPTYSFPLDVVEFNIEGFDGSTKLSPQRGIDIALSEYAPGRTIVVDKKTYKSGGIYSPMIRKDIENFYKPALPYFKEENGFYRHVYMCKNPLCGWFGKTMPQNNVCPFCGKQLEEDSERNVIRPWGFAPINAKEISESELDSELTYTDEPCYSATPSIDLKETKYPNLRICNRTNEEVIILNKGNYSEGFDICRDCGAAQPHNDKSLKENGIGAPFTYKGSRVTCSHRNTEEGVFLGTSFRTDMFFMQIYIDVNKITDDDLILKSAAITLYETMKLSASRILDISYNDLAIGTRTRSDGTSKFVDIYFYDSLSSGAGYSTQIEANLDEIFKDSAEVLMNDDNQDICNFWNQRLQHFFNKKVALDLLTWITKSKLHEDFSTTETENICVPLTNILSNENVGTWSIADDMLTISGNKFKISHAFLRKKTQGYSDFEITYSLPNVIEQIKRII